MGPTGFLRTFVSMPLKNVRQDINVVHVPKVSAIAQAGLELFFNSNDHLPPHFHAERPGEWEVRVHFMRDEAQMVETRWALKQPPKKALRSLCAAAAGARVALLVEWEQKVLVTAPGQER
jgi:hypothetical protein